MLQPSVSCWCQCTIGTLSAAAFATTMHVWLSFNHSTMSLRSCFEQGFVFGCSILAGKCTLGVGCSACAGSWLLLYNNHWHTNCSSLQGQRVVTVRQGRCVGKGLPILTAPCGCACRFARTAIKIGKLRLILPNGEERHYGGDDATCAPPVAAGEEWRGLPPRRATIRVLSMDMFKKVRQDTEPDSRSPPHAPDGRGISCQCSSGLFAHSVMAARVWLS
jgi:hypothetical protein